MERCLPAEMVHSGLMLDFEQASTAENVQLLQAVATDTGSQQRQIKEAGGGWGHLRTKSSGKFVTAVDRDRMVSTEVET